MQVLLHVGRDRTGRRRLTEISVLRCADSGLVQALTVWRAGRGFTDHLALLRQLLRDRMPA